MELRTPYGPILGETSAAVERYGYPLAYQRLAANLSRFQKPLRFGYAFVYNVHSLYLSNSKRNRGIERGKCNDVTLIYDQHTYEALRVVYISTSRVLYDCRAERFVTNG